MEKGGVDDRRMENEEMRQFIDKNESSFTNEDLRKMQKIFKNPAMTKSDIVIAWKNNEIIRIADAGDYEYVFEDFVKFEDGFEKELKNEITYETFLKELKKGYGKSGCVQIARLFELTNGVWYDNEYVG